MAAWNEGSAGGAGGIVIIALAAIAGIVVGLVASPLVFGEQQGKEENTVLPKAGLANEDKNFLVNIANSQVDLTTAKVAAMDWCTINGVTWNIKQQRGQLQVATEVVDQLKAQNVDVVQLADGNWAASVLVVARDVCMFPLTKE